MEGRALATTSASAEDKEDRMEESVMGNSRQA
jgi:hypothetical protein